MAVTPVNTKVTVATAGTRVQGTSDTSIRPADAYIEASGTNTGYIYVGLSNVSSTNYIARLSAGQGFAIGAVGHLQTRDPESGTLQLSSLYFDASVSGESAQLSYLPRG